MEYSSTINKSLTVMMTVSTDLARKKNTNMSRCKGIGLMMLTLAMLIGCQGNLPDDLAQQDAASGIIFVKAKSTFRTRNKFKAGGNLFSLVPAAPSGKLTNLTNLENGDVMAPEISFDGTKVLFSMRRSNNKPWHIYEMSVNGGLMTQLTFSDVGHNLDPIYLPDGNILFSSSSHGAFDEYERFNAEVLHVLDRSTGEIKRISSNMSDDMDPFVKSDGRIIYTRWDHVGGRNEFPLFFTNPDGSGTFTFFSPHANRNGRRVFDAREMPDGSVIAILSNQVLGDRGRIAIIKDFSTAAEPLEDGMLEFVTPDVPLTGGPYPDGVFRYPHPLPDGRIVASYSTPTKIGKDENGDDIEIREPDYGLYVMDLDGRNLTQLYNDPNTHEFEAVVISERPIPPSLTSILKTEDIQTKEPGVFTVQDVYFRQTRDGQEIPDRDILEAKTVLVVEGIPTVQATKRFDFGHTQFERQRIIGEAPIEADGSFSISVPPDIPLRFNVQDSLGRSIVTKRNWVSVRPGEKFLKCVGCHGPRGKNSGNPNPLAANRPPTDLNVAESARRDVSFSVVVQPIIDAKCSPCHGETNPAAGLELTNRATPQQQQQAVFTEAYDNLAAFINNGFSRRSKLIDMLFGVSNGSRVEAHPASTSQYALTKAEIDNFVKWVDLGGLYW